MIYCFCKNFYIHLRSEHHVFIKLYSCMRTFNVIGGYYMNRHRLGFIAGLLLLAGCSNNDFTDDGNIIPDGQKKTISSITAVMDEADTRAQLVEGHKVAWDQGDYMMVYSDLDEWDGRQYDLVSGAGTSTGSFEGDEMPGTIFYAFTGGNPFRYDREKQEISFYWIQEVIVGGEPSSIKRNIPMFAVSTDSNMTFKQLTGILHFQVEGTGSLVSAEICDNDGELIPESYTIGFKSEDITLQPFLGNGDEPVYYDSFGGNVKTSEGYVALSETEPVDIYFVLPSCISYENGFTLKLGVGDDTGNNVETVEKKFNKPFTVERGVVANFPTFNATTYTEEENKIALAGRWTLEEQSGYNPNVSGYTAYYTYSVRYSVNHDVIYNPKEVMYKFYFEDDEVAANRVEIETGWMAFEGDEPSLGQFHYIEDFTVHFFWKDGYEGGYMAGNEGGEYYLEISNGKGIRFMEKGTAHEAPLHFRPRNEELYGNQVTKVYFRFSEEEDGVGSLSGLGTALYPVNSHCTYSEDGWKLYFHNFTTDSDNAMAKYVKKMTITLDAALDDADKCPEYNGSNILVNISANPFGVTFENKSSHLSINHDTDGKIVVKLDGQLVSKIDGSEYNYSLEWLGNMPKM